MILSDIVVVCVGLETANPLFCVLALFVSNPNFFSSDIFFDLFLFLSPTWPIDVG